MTQILPNHPGIDERNSEITRLRAQLAASAEALERAVAAERERIIDRLEYEASMLPCFEDAESTRENAMLIRADFSYEELDRLKGERDAAAKRAREAGRRADAMTPPTRRRG